MAVRCFGMDGDGVWGRDLGVEEEREDEKDAGKIFEMVDGSKLEDTGLHDQGGIAKG